MIIYLHGFRSSPQSEKAQALVRRMRDQGMEDQVWCEQLPADPSQAIQTIERALSSAKKPPLLVGSSLGGYYATYLAERHHLKAVLINPAAYAYRILAPHLGWHQNLYTGERFELTQDHIDALKDFAIEPIRHPRRFWLLAETGDEVIDYREAVQKYQGAKQTVITGGNHSLTSFPQFIDAIIEHSMNGQPDFEVNV